MIKKNDFKNFEKEIKKGVSVNLVFKNKNNLAVTSINYDAWECLDLIVSNLTFNNLAQSSDKFKESLVDKILKKLVGSDNISRVFQSLNFYIKEQTLGDKDLKKIFQEFLSSSEISGEFLPTINAVKEKISIEKYDEYLFNSIIDNIFISDFSSPQVQQEVINCYNKNPHQFIKEELWVELVDGTYWGKKYR